MSYWIYVLWFVTNNWDGIKIVTSLVAVVMVDGVGLEAPMQAVMSDMLAASVVEKKCPQGISSFRLVIWFPFFGRFSSGSGSVFSPVPNRWLVRFRPNMSCFSWLWFGRWVDVFRMVWSGLWLFGSVWPEMRWFMELKRFWFPVDWYGVMFWVVDWLRIARKINAMQVFILNLAVLFGLSWVRASLSPVFNVVLEDVEKVSLYLALEPWSSKWNKLYAPWSYGLNCLLNYT